ncbi:cysteine-rich CWC family protein [Vibrio furnissii]|uniref:cysteine-rich CWC family protein n=1 Tax=Vibrio furnissii TaxID=29494 RepID=UPI001EEC2103|nr:cysteine-rich CWC family protein [Vibrio furnissii]
MKTPCIAACKNNGGICSGCRRTMDEIIQWRHLSDDERDTIMQRLSGQQSTHTCPACGEPTHCDISAGKSTCWCFDVEKRDVSTQPESSVCLCRKCLEKQPIE